MLIKPIWSKLDKKQPQALINYTTSKKHPGKILPVLESRFSADIKSKRTLINLCASCALCRR